MDYFYFCIGTFNEKNLKCDKCEDNVICKLKTHLNEEEKEKCKEKENAMENT